MCVMRHFTKGCLEPDAGSVKADQRVRVDLRPSLSSIGDRHSNLDLLATA